MSQHGQPWFDAQRVHAGGLVIPLRGLTWATHSQSAGLESDPALTSHRWRLQTIYATLPFCLRGVPGRLEIRMQDWQI